MYFVLFPYLATPFLKKLKKKKKNPNKQTNKQTKTKQKNKKQKKRTLASFQLTERISTGRSLLNTLRVDLHKECPLNGINTF